jgi:F420-dependent oxidoreductase-like protein
MSARATGLRIGLLIDRFDWPGGTAAIRPTLSRIARDAEDAGVSSVWLNDHLFQIPMFGEFGDPVMEVYTTLGFLAAATERVELGTLTTSAHYRPPGLLLKIVATLDVLSGGRAWLGVGPAWYEREQQAFGIPVPTWRERFERLEELLRIAHHMLDGDPAPFHGEHERLEEPALHPPPLRRPPILVGGVHERRLFPLVARYADACNLFEAGGVGLLRLKLRLLREHCERLGRPFDDLAKTTYGTIALSRRGAGEAETPAAAAERLWELAGEGIELAILSPADVTPGGLELLGELVEKLRPPARQAVLP